MRTEIHLLDINEHLNSPIDNYLAYISPERREKILRHKFLSNQNRSLWAELLAKKLIADLTGKSFNEVIIKRDENNKPYCDENIYFSLSHTGNFIACSIGSEINGIDIEFISSRANIEIAKRFYLPQEYSMIKFLHDNNLNWQQKFFEYWTLKESCLKCLNLHDWSNVDCEKLLSGCEDVTGRNFVFQNLIIGCCTLKNFLPESIIFESTLNF